MIENILKIGMAQCAPVWLNKHKTLEKVKQFVVEAADKKCDLIVFGEGHIPGYPFWLPLTQASAWNDKMQKEIYAHYIRNAIQIEANDLTEICAISKDRKIAIYLGVIERPKDRGGHSLYCSLVYIDKSGIIQSVHRKLQPTYDERLVWAPGDGHGLQVHKLNNFTLGGLNCWENWMPLARTALYGLGENVHIAVWPGGVQNTEDITRFIAKEGRSFVISVSNLMKKENITADIPHFEEILKNAPDILANGGSCIASPTGEWIVEPILNEEGLFIADIDINIVFEERQNFDSVGHYSRPDITKLNINRSRPSIIELS